MLRRYGPMASRCVPPMRDADGRRGRRKLALDVENVYCNTRFSLSHNTLCLYLCYSNLKNKELILTYGSAPVHGCAFFDFAAVAGRIKYQESNDANRGQKGSHQNAIPDTALTVYGGHISAISTDHGGTSYGYQWF